jgi:Flp pilus assembly pilin Flp
MIRRTWTAWQDVKDRPLTTTVKHAVLVALLAVLAVTGIAAMFQSLSEANTQGLERDQAITQWRNELRDHDAAASRYELCLIAVQGRIETRADNQRENESDLHFLDILDRWLGEGSDAALAEARAAEELDARLDDEARPLLDVNDCEKPGEAPPFPDVS